MLCFIKKSLESKEEMSPSYLYKKKNCEHKVKNLFAHVDAHGSNLKTNENNVYETNKKGPKMMWVSKVKT